jgi:FAD/FMN-containing dehydrogenase
MILSGWGQYPRTDVNLLKARSEEEIRTIVKGNASMIVRGNGRSYGDSALNKKATLSLLQNDRILEFDEARSQLTCEAGLLLSDLLKVFVPRGWFVPVTPGTKFVTIGGMIASDVHGKNHHLAGCFGNHVERLTLMLADGQIVNCSASEYTELFNATRGGMGLTGVILTATFKMKRIESAFIRQKTIRTKNLAETMQSFEESKESPYSVAWIDGLATGDKLGRSHIYLGEHAEAQDVDELYTALHWKPQPGRAIPFDMPDFVLSPRTVRIFNELYYRRWDEDIDVVHFEKFFYPLDKIRRWNRLYGKRGFVQYQTVLPLAGSAAGMKALLGRIATSGQTPFLAVLKLLGQGTGGMMSFPMEGYTLALDFPASPETFRLLDDLDAITAEYGGRIYLAKDARMKKTMMKNYPDLEKFQALCRTIDPTGKFSSLQSERLSISS